MLLAIDMGNTQTALGLFDNEELLHSWRMPTDRTFTKDELHVRLLGYFHKDGFDLAQVNAIAFAGVVPQLMREWEGVAEVLNARLVVVGRATASVTSIDAANPAEVGADRIANATAAAALYGSPKHRRRLRHRHEYRRGQRAGRLHRRLHRARHPRIA